MREPNPQFYDGVSMKDYENPELLRDLFSHDPESGRILHARDKLGGHGCIVAKAGAFADTYIGNHGYRVVSFTINGKVRKQLAHRVLYMLSRGRIPCGMVIDHINGVRSDNRLNNLRVLTKRENDQNRIKVRGTDWYKNRGCWRARITVAGNELMLGFYGTEEQAHAAYLTAKAIYHPKAHSNQTGIL
jgi:hypothetical protein